MGKPIIKGVVEQYCRENPDLPSRTLSRLLRREQPKLFASVEAARNIVRIVRGNHGEKKRPQATCPRANRQAGEVVLPKGMRQGKQPLRIPPGKVLVLSDMHCPYHDERAIAKAVTFGIKAGCDTLYLNGDVCDFYAISRWQKDPRERDLKHELTVTAEVLEKIGAQFDRKYYKCGNHEERWERFVWQRAEELVGVEGFSLEEVLRLRKLGYEFVHSRQIAFFGKLPVIHGHEGRLNSPVNPARGLWLKVLQTALCGHLHRSSHHSEPYSISKQSESCWSTGCLCDLSPEYAVLNKWNLGFAIVEHDKKGFQVENFKLSPDAKKSGETDMLLALLIFACQFTYIALLGLQQLNVVGRHYIGACVVSLLLGMCGYQLTAQIALAAHGPALGPVWWGYLAGGPLGICFGMWLHPRLRKWMEKRP